MTYINNLEYYTNNGGTPADANWGSYQYVGLYDILNNYMLIYNDNDTLVSNEERYKVLFHAKRGIQELNYDAFKEIKILQLTINAQALMILPPDYVNWVRISLYKNGYLMPLTENIQANTALAYLEDNNGNWLYDQNGNILSPQFSPLDLDRIAGTKKSIYLNQNSAFNGQEGYNVDGNWYFDYAIGSRFGLNTETANQNPTFRIDKQGGVINFNSTMIGEQCVLEYVSDGMEGGDDTRVSVNKLFEDYIYAYIDYAILSSKFGVQEYIISRAKKKKSALLRNAKIRLSNIHPGRLLMNLRGRDKWIK
jgi:hypothetical protein